MFLPNHKNIIENFCKQLQKTIDEQSRKIAYNRQDAENLDTLNMLIMDRKRHTMIAVQSARQDILNDLKYIFGIGD